MDVMDASDLGETNVWWNVQLMRHIKDAIPPKRPPLKQHCVMRSDPNKKGFEEELSEKIDKKILKKKQTKKKTNCV